MLFDLSSPRRKTAVRIIFGGLAAIFAISFIGFGIGSDATGGIFDALGIGGDDNSADNPQFQEDIDKAKADIAADPKDEGAQLRLAEASLLAANDELEQDPETGQLIFNEASTNFYDQGIEAWEDYLALKPKKPDEGVGFQVQGAYLQTFNNLIAGVPPDLTAIRDTLKGLVATSAILAEAQPSQNTLGTLVQYAYLAGETKTGDEAAQSMLAETDKAEQKEVEKFIEQQKKVGADFQERVKKAEKAEGEQTPEEAFSNPLSESLGGGGLTAPPPTAPGP